MGSMKSSVFSDVSSWSSNFQTTEGSGTPSPKQNIGSITLFSSIETKVVEISMFSGASKKLYNID